MLSLKDLLKPGVDPETLPADVRSNARELLEKVNRLLLAYKADGHKEHIVVTSGIRTLEEHQRIYREINAKRAKRGLPELKVPMGSMHLKGCAVDLHDPAGKMKQWCLKNEKVLVEVELWAEHPDATPTWLHVQIRPPRSGNRWFKP